MLLNLFIIEADFYHDCVPSTCNFLRVSSIIPFYSRKSLYAFYASGKKCFMYEQNVYI